MVLPVLGLLGLGAAGLFGSAGKAIAGGAGEQYADLYQDTMKEKLDYMKRKRLMEESEKLSRQSELLKEGRTNKENQQKINKEIRANINSLIPIYGKDIATIIAQGGNKAVTKWTDYAKNIPVDPSTGLKPDIKTTFELINSDGQLSDGIINGDMSIDDSISLVSDILGGKKDKSVFLREKSLFAPKEFDDGNKLVGYLDTIVSTLAVADILTLLTEVLMITI